MTTQPSAVEGALRAFDLLYGAAEPAVRQRFLKPAGQGADDLHWKLGGFAQTSTEIPVLYLKPRSAYGRSRFSDPQDLAMMEEVTSLPALHELSKRQAAVAFWAGAQLASGVIPELCMLVGRPACPQPRADSLKP